MKTRFSTLCLRWKNIGNQDASFSGALCFLVLTFFLLASGSAQTGAQPLAQSKSASLPQPFTRFSSSDVLKEVFASYDPATGRLSGIVNEDGKPARLEIETAGLWKVQGQDHLVVLVNIIGWEGPTGLCGSCLMQSFLAVLRKNGATLSLVARQLTVPSGGPVAYESLNQDEVITITGHDNVSLDLAPYKLNSREMLIGFRLEHIWLPTSDWSTSLWLYRIEGERLSEVFNQPVVERVYSVASDSRRRTVDKTVSTISLVPSSRAPNGIFNDLIIDKTTSRCFNKDSDEDCDSRKEGFRKLGTQTELWRFNGQRFAGRRTVRTAASAAPIRITRAQVT